MTRPEELTALAERPAMVDDEMVGVAERVVFDLVADGATPREIAAAVTQAVVPLILREAADIARNIGTEIEAAAIRCAGDAPGRSEVLHEQANQVAYRIQRAILSLTEDKPHG